MASLIQGITRAATVLRTMGATGRLRPRDALLWPRALGLFQNLSAFQIDNELLGRLFELFFLLQCEYKPIESGNTNRADGRSPAMPGGPADRTPRVALFADAMDHMSGVTTTLRQWSEQARQRDHWFKVHCVEAGDPFPGAVRFHPVGILRVPVYEYLKLNVPQASDVLAYLQREDFNIVHISTPGPMGLIALLAARLRNVPVCGTHHTNFPAYAKYLSGDLALEEMSWRFLQWFYGEFDLISAPSRSAADDLLAHGIPPEKIRVVGRGVNTNLFTPELRDNSLRATWFPDRPVKLLYIGRISREKNLACLAGAFHELCRQRSDAALIVVGDGPYREEMENELAGLPAYFTGERSGTELARIYASCDLFVFPSETDTLGNVVLEAQASGLPVLVSNKGGPKDCVSDGVTGLVLKNMTPHALARAIARLIEQPDRLETMRCAASAHASSLSPEQSFDQFWNMHADCLHHASEVPVESL